MDKSAKVGRGQSQMGGKAVGSKGCCGSYDQGRGAFSEPRDTGNGGIPLKFYDDLGTGATAARVVPTQTGRAASAEPRRGTRQYPFGGR